LYPGYLSLKLGDFSLFDVNQFGRRFSVVFLYRQLLLYPGIVTQQGIDAVPDVFVPPGRNKLPETAGFATPGTIMTRAVVENPFAVTFSSNHHGKTTSWTEDPVTQ
jgi:hypothetical protein